MFVVTKTFHVEKEHTEMFLNRFKGKSPLFKFDGFIKRYIMVSKKDKVYNQIRLEVFFKDKKAYYLWEGSPEHIASHKKPQEKPKGILNIEHLTYELVQIDHYEGI